MGVRPKRQ